MDKSSNSSFLEQKQRKAVLITSMFSQTESMKRTCVEQCSNLDLEYLTPEEKQCYKSCVGKVKAFVDYVDNLYQVRYF